MRISKISVKGLFGMFDHEIPLNQESRITIVHGPNGVGKTVLMRMVHGLFNFDYAYFDSIPFEQFCIDFENGYSVRVEKSSFREDSENETVLLVFYTDDRDENVDSFEIRVANNKFLSQLVEKSHENLVPIHMASRSPGTRAEDQYWISKDDKFMGKPNLLRPLSKQDILRRDPTIHTEACGKIPDWFGKIQRDVSPKHIPMARLTSATWDHSVFMSLEWNRKVLPEDGGSLMVPRLPDAVSEIHNGFILNFGLLEKISFANKWMREQEELIRVLDEGLVEDSEAATEVLEDHLLFCERRLDEYDSDIEYRAARFYCDSLNQRILFKYLTLDGELGIKAHLEDGSEVPLTALSSGEQQLLVLYYQLLFEVQPDTLVMIDEPELSMNVVWQRNFLKDLQRIIELRKFDVLIATHSPQIIHDKWDWVVHLGEKVDD